MRRAGRPTANLDQPLFFFETKIMEAIPAEDSNAETTVFPRYQDPAPDSLAQDFLIQDLENRILALERVIERQQHKDSSARNSADWALLAAAVAVAATSASLLIFIAMLLLGG